MFRVLRFAAASSHILAAKFLDEEELERLVRELRREIHDDMYNFTLDYLKNFAHQSTK